jgi:hypothetical protein
MAAIYTEVSEIVLGFKRFKFFAVVPDPGSDAFFDPGGFGMKKNRDPIFVINHKAAGLIIQNPDLNSTKNPACLSKHVVSTQIPKETPAYSRISSNGERTRLRAESESDDFSGLVAVGR